MTYDEMSFLRHQSILNGFSEDDFQTLLTFLKKKEYEPDETVFEENDSSSDMYLISRGGLKVLKWDDENLFQIPIGKFGPGDMFGEMSFMDGSPRSATIVTTNKTTVYLLSRQDLESNLSKTQPLLTKIFTNIATININRLRATNQVHVKSLRNAVRSIELRQNWGKFLILSLLFLAITNVIIVVAHRYLSADPIDYWTWGFWLVASLPILFSINRFHFYKDEWGFNKNELSKSLQESGLALLFGGAVIYFISLLYQNDSVDTSFHPGWFFGYFIYCCVYEMIVRGMLLTAFKKFFDDTSRWKSIFFVSLLGVVFPILTFMEFSSLTVGLFFFANIALSWLYLRYRTLVGVILLHFILGVFARYLLIA